MSFSLIDLLFNIVVLLFWIRLWNRNLQGNNHYLAGAESFTQPVLDLFRSISRSWSVTGTAAVAWLILIMFRAVALYLVNPDGMHNAWLLRLGFEGITPGSCKISQFPLFLIFSVLSFAIFIFQVWGFALLFLRGYRRVMLTDNVPEFLYTIARPFSDTPPRWQPWILLGYGTGILAFMDITARGWTLGTYGSVILPLLVIMRYAIVAISGAVNLLLILQRVLFVLIIGSWVVMFTGSNTLMIICREWLDFLLGPFRRFPLRIGPLDFTPIIAFLAIGIIHWVLIRGLYLVYVNLL